MEQKIYYSSAGANSPVDGWVQRQNVVQTFANIRAGAGNKINNISNLAVYLTPTSSNNFYSVLTRALMCFDTSDLGANAVIDSVTLSLYGQRKVLTLGPANLHVAGAVMSSHSTITNSDYENVLRVSFGYYLGSAFTVGAWNHITFNDAGKAYINKTGITPLSLQLSWDITGDTTGLVWGSGKSADMEAYSADSVFPERKPYLTVNYTIPSANYISPDKNQPTGYHCFMKQYIKNCVAGYSPLKLPTGETW